MSLQAPKTTRTLRVSVAQVTWKKISKNQKMKNEKIIKEKKRGTKQEIKNKEF